MLVGAAGLWIDEHPIPDIFSFMPFEFAEVLFHDRAVGEALLTGGLDLSNADALMEFYIANTKRLGMAGKIMFPIPNRRLAKRLYRLTTPTLLLWGKSDRLIPPVYADRFKALIPHAELQADRRRRSHAAVRATRDLRQGDHRICQVARRHPSRRCP